MSWSFFLASAFALGWAIGVWQCSRRRDCPRYAQYALEKWKREVVEPATRRYRGRLGRRVPRRCPTPPGEEES